MRYRKDAFDDALPGFFAGDLDGGGVMLECQACEELTPDYQSRFGDPVFCNGCFKELCYEEFWSW